jgi:acyl-CoA thioesterase-1
MKFEIRKNTMPANNHKFKLLVLISLIFNLAFLAACSTPAAKTEPIVTKETSSPAPAANSAPDNTPVILAFGDSLTEGYGLEKAQSYPSLLQARLQEKGYNYRVVNAGISGDTTAGGASRISAALTDDNVKIMILELGANNILRGQDLNLAKKQLAEIIEKAQAKKIEVILAGMEAPTNYGEDYQRAAHNLFVDLSKQYKLKLIPFFLTNVAGKPELNQGDGIHPNIEGTKLVLDNVWQVLEPTLKK